MTIKDLIDDYAMCSKPTFCVLTEACQCESCEWYIIKVQDLPKENKSKGDK